MNRFWVTIGCLALLVFATADVVCAEETTIPPDLERYVARPESVFSWKLNARHETEVGNVYDLSLTSQTWHDIVWKHALFVYEPKTIRHPRHMLLMVTGGSNGRKPGPDDWLLGLQLAKLCQARVATLHQVPNQPLFDNRREDDLITETWLRYLESGDATWPLLFPMVKSAVKAMDALQQLSVQEWKTPVEGFVITGGSKRGWTSWLTPVADRRVIATAPIVIDVLNFMPQMRRQIEVWGEFSEQIADYTRKGLVTREMLKLPLEQQPERRVKLWRMMDPYTYRSRLTLPKLLIIGTNDRYWVLDALNIYWDDLVGSKYIRYVPNAGHGLNGGRDGALVSLAAFFQHAASAKPMPQLEWKHADDGGALKLEMKASPKPVKVLLWTAHSDDLDFRDAQWTSRPLAANSETFVGEVPIPESGHVALFGEMHFTIGGLEYALSTQVRRK